MRKLAAFLAVVLVLAATVTACWLVNVLHESQEQEVMMNDLRQQAVKPAVTDLYGGYFGVMEVDSSEGGAQSRNALEERPTFTLHDFVQLQRDNPDCIAWVSIPGTAIDFPVMQSTEAPEFYLKHDFKGNYTDYGLPFLDERCNLETADNLIIYGHHMNDGSMFSELLKYEDKSYFEQHPEIILLYAPYIYTNKQKHQIEKKRISGRKSSHNNKVRIPRFLTSRPHHPAITAVHRGLPRSSCWQWPAAAQERGMYSGPGSFSC